MLHVSFINYDWNGLLGYEASQSKGPSLAMKATRTTADQGYLSWDLGACPQEKCILEIL